MLPGNPKSQDRTIGHAIQEPIEPAAPIQFTRRQWDVVRLTVRGLTDQEIGEVLFITEWTVKDHQRGFFRRLGARRRSEIAWLIWKKFGALNPFTSLWCPT